MQDLSYNISPNPEEPIETQALGPILIGIGIITVGVALWRASNLYKPAVNDASTAVQDIRDAVVDIKNSMDDILDAVKNLPNAIASAIQKAHYQQVMDDGEIAAIELQDLLKTPDQFRCNKNRVRTLLSTLTRAMQAVDRQGHQGLSNIVMKAPYISAWWQGYSTLQVLEREQDRGISSPLNSGVTHSYIKPAFDDFITRDTAFRSTQAYMEFQRLGIGKVLRFNNNTATFSRHPSLPWRSYYNVDGEKNLFCAGFPVFNADGSRVSARLYSTVEIGNGLWSWRPASEALRPVNLFPDKVTVRRAYETWQPTAGDYEDAANYAVYVPFNQIISDYQARISPGPADWQNPDQNRQGQQPLPECNP